MAGLRGFVQNHTNSSLKKMFYVDAWQPTHVVLTYYKRRRTFPSPYFRGYPQPTAREKRISLQRRLSKQGWAERGKQTRGGPREGNAQLCLLQLRGPEE